MKEITKLNRDEIINIKHFPLITIYHFYEKQLHYFKNYKDLLDFMCKEQFNKGTLLQQNKSIIIQVIKNYFSNLILKIEVTKSISFSGINKELVITYNQKTIYFKKLLSDVISKLGLNNKE